MHPNGPEKRSPRKRDRQLVQLLLRVAQRADELARLNPTGGSAHRDRETWLQAEAETVPRLPGAAHG